MSYRLSLNVSISLSQTHTHSHTADDGATDLWVYYVRKKKHFFPLYPLIFKIQGQISDTQCFHVEVHSCSDVYTLSSYTNNNGQARSQCSTPVCVPVVEAPLLGNVFRKMCKDCESYELEPNLLQNNNAYLSTALGEHSE